MTGAKTNPFGVKSTEGRKSMNPQVPEVPDLVESTTVSSPRLIAEKYMQNF